jgi:UV radiation resistance-associated gene protein
LKLENFQYPFPPNCVIFYLSDGIYTNLTDLAPQQSPTSLFKAPKSVEDDTLPTSSYDALMRLSTLDDCIQDALITREKLASQINTILKENQGSLDVVSEASRCKESLATTNRYLAAERRRLGSATKRRAELKASLEARNEAMQKGREAQAKAQNYLDEATEKLKDCGVLVERTTGELRGQRRRICEDLIDIFPIEPVS